MPYCYVIRLAPVELLLRRPIRRLKRRSKRRSLPLPSPPRRRRKILLMKERETEEKEETLMIRKSLKRGDMTTVLQSKKNLSQLA